MHDLKRYALYIVLAVTSVCQVGAQPELIEKEHQEQRYVVPAEGEAHNYKVTKEYDEFDDQYKYSAIIDDVQRIKSEESDKWRVFAGGVIGWTGSIADLDGSSHLILLFVGKRFDGELDFSTWRGFGQPEVQISIDGEKVSPAHTEYFDGDDNRGVVVIVDFDQACNMALAKKTMIRMEGKTVVLTDKQKIAVADIMKWSIEKHIELSNDNEIKENDDE